MKILVVNGNPKKDGFIAGALDTISSRLAAGGAQVERLRLADQDIRDCVGCMTCLRTGKCILDDDMGRIIAAMLEADGLVVGSPVRNGLTTACFKRFYERISYPLGFTLLIEDKHTLAVSSVGIMGGKAVNRRLLGLQDLFHTRLSGYLFFKVGMPRTLDPGNVRGRLERAAARLIDDISRRRQRRLWDRAACAVDRFVVGRFMLARHPEAFAHVIQCWKDKGYI